MFQRNAFIITPHRTNDGIVSMVTAYFKDADVPYEKCEIKTHKNSII